MQQIGDPILKDFLSSFETTINKKRLSYQSFDRKTRTKRARTKRD